MARLETLATKNDVLRVVLSAYYAAYTQENIYKAMVIFNISVLTHQIYVVCMYSYI